MRKIRLRTKFLISLLAISAGLTAATLIIVSYNIEKRIRGDIRVDLENSVNNYRRFERQRRDSLARSAQLLASLPNIRALMTTHDSATIQDGSAEVWRMSGTDLLLMSDRSGNVAALRTKTAGLSRADAQTLLRKSLDSGEDRGWWFGGGHLYETWVQPIYFGAPGDGSTLGFLVIGHEIQDRAAHEFGNIVTGDVAYFDGGVLVASTLSTQQKHDLEVLCRNFPGGTVTAKEVQLGRERFLVSTVALSDNGDSSVTLSIFKSLDRATSFLRDLNRVLLGLGVLSVLGGSVLVFLISGSFTRPLENLVGGVRALEQGDFRYPLEVTSGDEVAEVTAAFDRMRATMQKSQLEHKGLEERLRQAHKMEAVGRLAGGVAHDFNNLLTIIRGHSDLMLDRGSLEDSQRHNLDQIQKASSKAVTMTRQLLAFSRMQVLQPRVLDLNAIVTDLGKMLPRLIGEDIEYVFVPDSKLASVKADPGQIEQVLMNMVVNSRDAMPNGGTITVRTRNIVIDEAEAQQRAPMLPGEYVLLSVSDTGMGMSAETKVHIFEPFFTTKEVGKGTGLGLATVYGVVKQSGGFVWVKSSLGQGATFEIYLPRVSDRAARHDGEYKPAEIMPGHETILVVEDENDVRDLACEFLTMTGYSVLRARNGIEALDMLRRHPNRIDLVLSDVVMPKMGGSELAACLPSVRPGTKILLMSGYSEYAVESQNRDRPQHLVLSKPFSRSSLIEKIREALAAAAAPAQTEPAPVKGV
ncbi:MAG TPA: ATP-binding protein [Candidatus Acidoferrum sp.]|jgi:signal transduction histidine kinase/CheY-like chemotaxis protein